MIVVRHRLLILGLLLTIILVTVLLVAWGWLFPGPAVPPSWGLTPAEQSGSHVVAYYFYAKYRCRTCRTIERVARKVLEEDFGGALESGVLIWHPIDIDEPRFRHFHEDFEMPSRTLVLALVDGPPPPRRFHRLDEAWPLAHKPEKLERYIRAEVAAFLAASGVSTGQDPHLLTSPRESVP